MSSEVILAYMLTGALGLFTGWTIAFMLRRPVARFVRWMTTGRYIR